MTSAAKPSNAHRALGALRELILSGEMSAGSDHLESELAHRLNMSRTPIREAVLVLESQGLLEVRPRKGVRILPVSPSDMREVYDVLTALESLAAERAAMAGYGVVELEPMAETIALMDNAIARENRQAWAVADDAFHTELVRLGGNARVIEIVERMSDQVRRARAVTLFAHPLPSQSNEDHRAVYHAIRQGDPLGAGARHRRHREQARDMLVELLGTMGLSRV